jgi:hypothetical protein
LLKIWLFRVFQIDQIRVPNQPKAFSRLFTQRRFT